MRVRDTQLLLDTLCLQPPMKPEALSDAWRSADVEGLISLAAFEGAELWLLRRLQFHRVAVPPASLDRLRRLARTTAANNMRIDAQVGHVVALLRAVSIPCLLMKGQARRAAAGLYPDADARGVSDVDLLVPEAMADEAWHCLCRNGFRRVFAEATTWRADHHRPALVNDSAVAVELHTTSALTVPPEEAWRRATTNADRVEWQGQTVEVPSATEMLWQALAHGVADGTRSFTLRAFLSASCVLGSGRVLDWSLIADRLASDEIRENGSQRVVAAERAKRWLAHSAILSGTALPAPLRPERPIDLRPLLAWRASVLRRHFSPAVSDRLLEESLRSEAQMPLTEGINGSGVLRRVRRRVASRVARLAYVTWRATQ